MSLRTARPRAFTPNLFGSQAAQKAAWLAFGAAASFALLGQSVAFGANVPAPRDVFSPAPPAVTASSRWQGIYAGVGVSALLRDTKIDRGLGLADFSEGVATITPGIYAGYNFDGPGNFIWGFEADAVFTGKGTTFTDPTLGTFERRGRFLGTARLRAGVEAGNALFFGTAGLAVSNFEVRPNTVANTDVNWRAGVAIGAGVEYALNDQWSVRGEGIYTHFGEQNDISFAGTNRKVNDASGQIRIGLTRSF